MDPAARLIKDMTEQEIRAVLRQLAARRPAEVVSAIVDVLDVTRAADDATAARADAMPAARTAAR